MVHLNCTLIMSKYCNHHYACLYSLLVQTHYITLLHYVGNHKKSIKQMLNNIIPVIQMLNSTIAVIQSYLFNRQVGFCALVEYKWVQLSFITYDSKHGICILWLMSNS